MQKISRFFMFSLLLAVPLAQAETVGLSKLCGAEGFKATMPSGSFVLNGDRGHVTAAVTPTRVDLNQGFKVEKITKAFVSKDDPIIQMLTKNFKLKNPQDPTEYELTALDSSGSPAPLQLGADARTNLSSSFAVLMIPYERNKNLVIIRFREQGDEVHSYSFFYGTNDCEK